MGFASNLGYCEIEEAEIAIILDGLKMAYIKGCKRLVIETDSLEARNLILSNDEGVGKVGELLLTCLHGIIG